MSRGRGRCCELTLHVVPQLKVSLCPCSAPQQLAAVQRIMLLQQPLDLLQQSRGSKTWELLCAQIKTQSPGAVDEDPDVRATLAVVTVQSR